MKLTNLKPYLPHLYAYQLQYPYHLRAGVHHLKREGERLSGFDERSKFRLVNDEKEALHGAIRREFDQRDPGLAAASIMSAPGMTGLPGKCS